MATATRRRTKPKKLGKAELEACLNGEADRAMHLDLVGTAEAALNILKVERARIGKWRRNGIVLGNGERIQFPEPIRMATTSATLDDDETPDHSKLAATPLWWTSDIVALKKRLAKNKPKD